MIYHMFGGQETGYANRVNNDTVSASAYFLDEKTGRLLFFYFIKKAVDIYIDS